MKNAIKILIGLALATIGSQAQAIVITPGEIDGIACTPTTCWTTNDNTNLTAAEVATLVGYTGTLEEYYKADAGGAPDEGGFQDSYDTMFTFSETDPSAALIEYITSTSITCPDCYLLVKDGNKNPAQYVFDIGAWDGISDIELSGFWAVTDEFGVTTGAISHISIYGAIGQVPEPGMVSLLAIGLLGMVVTRRRIKV